MVPSNERSEHPLMPLDAAVEAALIANRREFTRFLSRRLGRDDRTEDILQEFCVRALSRAGGIRKSESIVAWLYRVLRSTLVDHVRSDERRARHESAYAREQMTQTEGPDVDLHAVACRCVYLLLPALRPEYAEILRRVDLLGETRTSVAQALGLTSNNLAVRLHRARQALKRALLLSCETCPEHGFLDCGCDLPIRRLAASAKA